MDQTLITQLRISRMSGTKPNFADLARRYDVDWRTVRSEDHFLYIAFIALTASFVISFTYRRQSISHNFQIATVMITYVP